MYLQRQVEEKQKSKSCGNYSLMREFSQCLAKGQVTKYQSIASGSEHWQFCESNRRIIVLTLEVAHARICLFRKIEAKDHLFYGQVFMKIKYTSQQNLTLTYITYTQIQHIFFLNFSFTKCIVSNGNFFSFKLFYEQWKNESKCLSSPKWVSLEKKNKCVGMSLFVSLSRQRKQVPCISLTKSHGKHVSFCHIGQAVVSEQPIAGGPKGGSRMEDLIQPSFTGTENSAIGRQIHLNVTMLNYDKIERWHCDRKLSLLQKKAACNQTVLTCVVNRMEIRSQQPSKPARRMEKK